MESDTFVVYIDMLHCDVQYEFVMADSWHCINLSVSLDVYIGMSWLHYA